MTEQQEKVNAWIERLERHQKALGLSDARFAARYHRYIGSSKTWRERLCSRSWGEFGARLGKWEKKLAQFVAELDGSGNTAEFLEALPIARYALAAYDILQGKRSDRRCAWLIAPTGCGKTWAMQRLARENPAQSAYLHVNRGAKDSMMILTRLLARAAGATEETGGSATYLNVVDALKSNALTMLIDDVHEGGVLLLKLLKHLVDETPVKLILGTYPTAWRALINGSTDAHAEAQQLIGRSIKPIERRWENGLTEEDVEVFLKATLGGNGECRVCAERIAPKLRRNGNLRTLADALEAARASADEDNEDLSAAHVEAAVNALCPETKKEVRI